MALLIVAIHTDAFSGPWLSKWALPILNIAVPVFFILSSMFYFIKLRQSDSKRKQLRHFFLRIATLYLFWFIINLPFTLAEKKYFIQGGAIDLLRMAKDILLGGTYFGSWFLSALLICVTLFTICNKKQIFSFTLIIVSLLSFIYTTWNSYMPEKYQILNIWWTQNIHDSMYLSFFEGLPWVCLGYLLSLDVIQTFLKKCNVVKHTILLVILTVVLFAYLNNYNFGNVSFNRIFLLFISPLLVIIAGSSQIKPSTKYLFLRKASILFFFSHFIFIQIIGHFCENVREYIGNMEYYLVVLLCCLIFTIAVMFLKDKKGFNWLRYSF